MVTLGDRKCGCHGRSKHVVAQGGRCGFPATESEETGGCGRTGEQMPIKHGSFEDMTRRRRQLPCSRMYGESTKDLVVGWGGLVIGLAGFPYAGIPQPPFLDRRFNNTDRVRRAPMLYR